VYDGRVGEDRSDTHSGGSLSDRLTISEAAALLGVHNNTVRNRIKDGTYEAEKVVTERGPTYLIERESIVANLATNVLSIASQELVSPQAMELVQELLRPFVNELGQVREQLGAERTRREIAEERAATLEAELEALQAEPEPRESPETASEGLGRETVSSDQEPVAQPSWWASPWLDAVIAILVVGGIAGLALLITLILSL
jgi:excisionase family DNA binding protein